MILLIIAFAEMLTKKSAKEVEGAFSKLVSFLGSCLNLGAFLYLQYVLYRGLREYRLLMYTRIQK